MSTTTAVAIVAGLALGSVYAIIALSFSLVAASTRYVNFALASVVSLGGIGAYYATSHFRIPAILSFVLVFVGGAIAGALLDLIARRPFTGRTNDVGKAVLLATIGLSIAIDAAVGLLFGQNPQLVPPYIDPTPVRLGPIPIPPTYFVMIAVTLGLAVILELLLRLTRVGRELTATQQDAEGAALLGQNVELTTTAVFAIAGGLAAVAGYLITPITDAASGVGSSLLISVIAALTIGGFGSFRGALVGAWCVGLVTTLVPLALPVAAVHPILLGVIVVILIFRPQGLFGSVMTREV